MINILEALGLSFGVLWFLFIFIDFIVYTIKKAPKFATFDLNSWRIGFVTGVITLAYFIFRENLINRLFQ